MSDEKITISMDEVNHATPVPGTTVPPNFTSEYVPPETNREIKPNRIGLFVGIGIAAVAFLCAACIGIVAFIGDLGIGPFPSSRRTVSEYRAETMREIEVELAKPDSKWRKRIEDAHFTVTVKSTEIIHCDVTTFDGSEKAGPDNSNIDKVSLLIRFNWAGNIDTGYTDLRVVYDVQNKRILKSEIEYTTALFNGEDPEFWFGVGSLLLSL